MPTGLLPEPLLVGANNLFGRHCGAMSPNLYRSHAQCLPLNLLSPLAYCALG
jgi:hypothetical protein